MGMRSAVYTMAGRKERGESTALSVSYKPRIHAGARRLTAASEVIMSLASGAFTFARFFEKDGSSIRKETFALQV